MAALVKGGSRPLQLLLLALLTTSVNGAQQHNMLTHSSGGDCFNNDGPDKMAAASLAAAPAPHEPHLQEVASKSLQTSSVPNPSKRAKVEEARPAQVATSGWQLA